MEPRGFHSVARPSRKTGRQMGWNYGPAAKVARQVGRVLGKQRPCDVSCAVDLATWDGGSLAARAHLLGLSVRRRSEHMGMGAAGGSLYGGAAPRGSCKPSGSGGRVPHVCCPLLHCCQVPPLACGRRGSQWRACTRLGWALCATLSAPSARCDSAPSLQVFHHADKTARLRLPLRGARCSFPISMRAPPSIGCACRRNA